MPRGFFGITIPGVHVQRGKPAMGRDQAGQHGERCFKCQGSALAMAKARKSDSQIEMPQRQKMLQADGQQRVFCGFFVAALPEARHRQAQMRLGAVSIDFESTLESALGVWDALLSKVSFADAQVKIRKMRIGLLRFQQA
jgi:hypothetical protein